MDAPIMGLWSELQKNNKLPKGTLTANCELELQELMKQIDKMVAGKKKDWERERDAIQSRLGVREKECHMQKSTLEQKHKEIGQLRVQLDSSENKQRELVGQYEAQLNKLRSEVQTVQREYERQQKRHKKFQRETERDREKSSTEIQDGMTEVNRLNRKLEDYRQRSKEWEIDRRALQKQVENLESQRKAIADKCEFVQHQFEDLERHRSSLMEKCEYVQQQAQTYQSQLDRRREILDSTELSFNAQIAQLEAKLSTTVESLKMQNGKVDKLKQSLEEAMGSHKKAMDDNERLLNDLKKTSTQNRKLEDLVSELQAELRARDDFLTMSEEDSKQHARDIDLLNKQIAEKDEIIKQLSETRGQLEKETLHNLRKNLTETEEEARLSKRNESLMSQENHQLQEELGLKRDECDNLDTKLQQKKADVAKLEEELSSVKSQLTDAQQQLGSMTGSHDTALLSLQAQLTNVTSELDSSNGHLGKLTERTSELEKQVELEQDEVKKRDAELKVGNAQIEALRLENRHLRQTIIQQTQVNLDHTETESQLREIQDQYQGKLKAIEKENVTLKDELGIMQKEISSMEDQYDQTLQRTMHEAEMSHAEQLSREQRRLQEIEEDSDRRVSMLQDRLDSTINRYEEQLQLLRRQKSRLEDDLDRERRSGASFHHGEIVIEDDEGVMYVNDDMSLTEANTSDELAFDMPVVGETASQKFLEEESARTRHLESIIDGHIETLKSTSDFAIKKGKR